MLISKTLMIFKHSCWTNKLFLTILPSNYGSTNSSAFCARYSSNFSTKAERWTRPEKSMLCYATSLAADGVRTTELTEVAVPVIARPSDVLVEVQAASINALDVLMMRGYGHKLLSFMKNMSSFSPNCYAKADTSQELPLIVGRDFCGVVAGLGGGVQGLQLGQRVMGVVEPMHPGCHAQYVLVDQNNVVPAPSHLSAPEVAAVPYCALTAYSAAGRHCSTSGPRGRVLVAGASGGVGLLLVQMLRAWGAHVAGVCSADAFDLLTSLGITELYDYSDPHALRELFADKSFDLVVDGSGCADLPYVDALKRHAGAVYVTLTLPLLPDVDRHGVVLGAAKSGFNLLAKNRESAREGRIVKWGLFRSSRSALQHVADMLQNKQLTPVLDKVFPWGEAKEAYKHMEGGRHRGKTVIHLTND
ncbi:reticulon-4-interacting protein 1, mitochondrial [Hyalella azteca]|uniref:Reticulon-4-interacting protein 1, mitochondrial n=1 Tax=Hyalella azteca TaxID=294128 RepID=A0A8B7NI61_HYAAZ|nr:reticulon-4-interacting protein 1, mitochondrial [Hyalella azteca]